MSNEKRFIIFFMRFNGWSRDEREQKNIIFFLFFGMCYCVRILQMILRFFNDSYGVRWRCL